ncbi:hypothetical protein ACFFTM_16100 [Pseudoduganella plicata]|uniref:hypothetical protein n=1 Tax=Pseudoduganella plicata TaxID=321984 RepID=UPI0035E69E3D
MRRRGRRAARHHALAAGPRRTRLRLRCHSDAGCADLDVSIRIRRNGAGAAKVEHVMLRYDGREYRIGGAAPWWFVTMPLGG